MRKFITAFLLILLFGVQGFSQEELKNYLLNVKDGEQSVTGLNTFRNGNYKEAYQLLKSKQNSNLFDYENFLKNALMYQRDSVLLRKELKNGNIKLSERETFYANQNQMIIQLDGKTTVDLSKNILTGIIGNDTITILFDTGGDGISINSKFVEKYNMVVDTSVMIEGFVPAMNYKSISHPTIIPKLEIGEMTLYNLPAKYKKAVIKDGVKIKNAPKVDMIMGVDIFVGLLNYIEFNWEAKSLTFSNLQHDLEQPHNYVMFDAKPICLFSTNDEPFTALLDTGSPVDILPKNIYLNNYTKKEAKQYGNFKYNDYTVLANIGEQEVSLVAADYKPDFNLYLNDQKIDFIIGNNKKFLKLDLVHNQYEIE